MDAEKFLGSHGGGDEGVEWAQRKLKQIRSEKG